MPAESALVLVLLPPSEGKTDADAGPSLDLGGLVAADLAPQRQEALDALLRLARGPRAAALRALGLTTRQAGELARNAVLDTAPTAPAVEVYTGVLYDALEAASLTAAARRRLGTHVAIQSALFGVVLAGDPIPAYRLSADSRLPRLGLMAPWWSRHLDPAMSAIAADGPVLDLRSSAYAAMWRPSAEVARRTVVGRVLLESQGRRSVVSHHNKATKGRLVRHLVSRRGTPRDIEGLAGACEEAGMVVELREPVRAGTAWTMDLVVTST